jgi:hypothetical protein
MRVRADNGGMDNMNITPDSLNLFLALANDADNWGGTPLLELSPAERGNLTQLKQADLLTTFTDPEDGCVFAEFTDAGVALAVAHGIELGI